MASLRDIRKRIRSVKNTQKITGAMKLVAASKLRKAQEANFAARPYAYQLGSLLHRVASRSGKDDSLLPHPLLEMREARKVLLVVISSDRGLCGAFNSNLFKKAERFLKENRERYSVIEVATIGRKASDYFQKRKVDTIREYKGVYELFVYRRALEIATSLGEEFVRRELDAVFLLYNEFASAIAQRVTVENLLPIVAEELPVGDDIEYIYEPHRQGVLDALVPRYVATMVWHALLESYASEQAARMTAMDSATRNAKELVEALTLKYNRVRQAAIARELMDIIGGAEAIKN